MLSIQAYTICLVNKFAVVINGLYFIVNIVSHSNHKKHFQTFSITYPFLESIIETFPLQQLTNNTRKSGKAFLLLLTLFLFDKILTTFSTKVYTNP